MWLQRLKGLEGLIVIDVVEGTALAALPLMHRVIHNRPPSFPTIATAQAWAKSSGNATVVHVIVCCQTSLLSMDIDLQSLSSIFDRRQWGSLL